MRLLAADLAVPHAGSALADIHIQTGAAVLALNAHPDSDWLSFGW
jgi:hypothetical protein